MASTTTPRRIALAQIKDSHLNISNSSDGINKGSASATRCGGGIVIGNSLSPYPRKKLHRDLTPLKSVSMAEYKYKRPKQQQQQQQQTTETKDSASSSVTAAVTAALKAAAGNTSPTINDTAGLAATKLKLKLQLAFYKIQKRNKLNKTNNSIQNISILPRSSSITNISRITTNSVLSEKPRPKPAVRCVSLLAPSLLPTPIYKTPPLVHQKSFLPTPSPPTAISPPLVAATNYAKSANVNLQTKTKLLSDVGGRSQSIRPSLSFVASQPQTKTRKQNQKLRLLQIKKNSIMHQPQRTTALTINSKNSNSNNTTTTTTTSTAPLAIRLPRIANNQSFSRGTSLPSIQKILKTPIKNSSSTRSLVSSLITNEDTIEEDDTVIETNNSPDEVSKVSSKTRTAGAAGGDETMVLLSSSPASKDDFGTPNLFSVAKSLLQLGGYKM